MMIDTVRAKFRCGFVCLHADGSVTVHMSAVYSNDPNSENRKFSDATPHGHFQMSIKAGGPVDFFREGDELYVDFTGVPTTDR